MGKKKRPNIKLRLLGSVKHLTFAADCICRTMPAKFIAETNNGSLYLCDLCLHLAKQQANLPLPDPYVGRRGNNDAMLRKTTGSAFSGKRR